MTGGYGMQSRDKIMLLLLALIWSSSFVFMRVLAPEIGPIFTTHMRVLFGGLVLMGYVFFLGTKVGWKQQGRHYLIVGVLNSALPFSLYSYAALHLPVSYLALLNASTPLFATVFAVLWLGDYLNTTRVLGLIAGMAGVGMVAKVGMVNADTHTMLSVIACLGAAMSYALNGIYLKKYTSGIPPMAIAAGSQIVAALAMVVSLPVSIPHVTVFGLKELGLVFLYGATCSGIAFYLYYALVERIGPTKTATVTFIIPAFGICWGALLFNETITVSMLLGCVFIVAGTVLVLRQPKRLPPPVA